jgi:hypothetical protein
MKDIKFETEVEINFPDPYLKKIKIINPNYKKTMTVSRLAFFYSLFNLIRNNKNINIKNFEINTDNLQVKWGEISLEQEEVINKKIQNAKINNMTYLDNIKVQQTITGYKDEKQRILKMKYWFNNLNKNTIKSVHLSEEICSNNRKDTSKTNLKQFVPFIKKWKNYRKERNTEENKQSVDCFFIIVNSLFQYYTETLDYLIALLTHEPYNYYIEEFMYIIDPTDFQFDHSNDIFKVKHYDQLKSSINGKNAELIVVKKYRGSDRYDIIFE